MILHRCFRLREAQQKELDYCNDLERQQLEMDSRLNEAERAREDALYDGVNLHVHLANKEEALRECRLQIAKLEVFLLGFLSTTLVYSIVRRPPT